MKINCINCGKETERYAMNQKYCPPCSSLADNARKIMWAKNNRKKVNATARKIHKRYRSETIIKGRNTNSQTKHGGILWKTQSQYLYNVGIGCRISVPFDWNYSKNALWRTGRGGHVYIRQEAKALKEALILQIQERKIKWRINKVFLEILVQKPSMQGDAINVIDTIADAVKKGIGLDDNWFCIERLDWEIVKENPKIWIGIMQENEDSYPCSYCGIFQPLSHYRKNKSTTFGIGTGCKTCLSKKLK